MTVHLLRVLRRLVFQSAATAAFLFVGAVWGQGWPPGMTAQDFEKMQRFFRALDEGMKPAAGPVEEEFIHDPETRDLSLAEIAGIEKALPRLFFLEPEPSGGTAVKSPLFVLPNAEHIQMQVQWTGFFNAQKKNVLRKPTASELEEDRSFQRVERITNGEYNALLRAEKNQAGVSAAGTADVSIPLRFFRAEFDCAKPGSAKAGPHEFTLVRCENDYAEIRQKTTDRTPLDVDIRLYGAKGRLKVSQQSTDAVFPGGRSIVDLTYKNRPDKIEGRRFRYLAHGRVARVVVLLPAQAAKKRLQVQALAEPSRENTLPVQNRYERAVPLPETSVMLPETALRGVQAQSTRLSAYFGFNEPGVLFALPPHPGRDYAVCEFSHLDLVDENGESVPFETAFAGYDRERKGCHVRFQTESGEVPAFSRARGSLKLRYPLSFSSYLTDGSTAAPGVHVQIRGMKVTVQTNEASAGSSLLGLAALNGRLYPLRPLSSVQQAPGGQPADHFFWGRVEKVWFVVTSGWIEMEKSFDLQPAAPLSDADRGKTNVHRNH